MESPERYGREITPKQVSSFTHAEIAACGLTKSKATYILGVAENPDGFLSPNWDKLTDSEIHKHFVEFQGDRPMDCGNADDLQFIEAEHIQYWRYWAGKSSQNFGSRG